MKTKPTILHQLILCLGLFLLAGALNLQAGNDTWNGLGTDNFWNTTTNWTAASANRPPASGDVLYFDGSTRLTASNNFSAYNIQGIFFNTTAGSFTLAGNLITNIAAITDNSPNLQTIKLNIAHPSTHTLNAAAGATLAINGVISGVGGITKAGGGTVTFNGINPQTFTGGATINAGTLTLDYVTGAPGPNVLNKGNVLTLGGGTLNLLGTGSIAISSNAFASTTINAGNSTVAVTNSAGAAIGAITENVGGTVVFNGPATTNAAGAVAAIGTITTTTAGTGALGAIGGWGTSGKNGAYATVGQYDFASTDTALGGAGTSPYTILGGSQVAGFYQTNGINMTTAFYDVWSGGTNTLGNAAGSPGIRFNNASALTINFSSTTAQNVQGILVTPTCSANNETITNNGLEFYRSSTAGACYGVIWQNNTLGYLNFYSIIEAGRLLNGGGGTTCGLVQAGPGTVAYLAVNDYDLSTYLNGGFSVVTADSGFGRPSIGGTVNMNGGTIVGNATFTMDNGGANKRPIVLSNNGGGLAATTGNTMTIDGAVSGSGPLISGIPASSANGNIVGVLPGSGTGTANAEVDATGTVSLSGTNTYTGNTVISSGTLALVAPGSISNSPVITTAPNAVFDVSAVPGFTLLGSQSLAGNGTNNGSVNTTSGSIIYAGTDGTYGTNTFNNNLTNVTGALIYMDVGTVYNGSNDLISVGGTLALNNTVFHLKAPSTSVNLDSADYVLMTAASISGAPFATPVWDIPPANAANYTVATNSTSVLLHYSASAPPAGSATASPNPVNRNQSTRITVNVTSSSTPVGSVVLNATLIGGSSSITLVQSNTSSLYTNTVTVSAGTSPNGYSLPITITDTSSPTPLATTIYLALTVVNTQTWDGLATDNNWSSSANWVSTVAPVTGDYLTFAGATRTSPAMDANNNLTGLAFASGAASFTLGTPGNSLTLSANGITNNSANLQTVNLPITLTAAQNINAAAGNLTISQAITNGGNLLSFDGSSNSIVSGSITGAGGLTKNGAGTVTLQAANTYSGSTTVAFGILEVTNSGVINGAVASVSANSGAEFLVDGGTVTATSGNIGVPSTGLLVSSGGTVNYSGALNMDLGNNNNALINVSGGTLTANSMALGRTSLNNGSQPASGSTSQGLYIHSSGSVIITNNLSLSTSSLANSSANARMDSGSLTVGGVLTIGLNNSGRWSDFDLSGGTLTVNDTATGIDIGGPFAGPAVLLLRGGTATAGKISFGQTGSGSTNMSAVLSLTGSSLYVGSGGLAQVSTGAGFVSIVNLTGGTLGAANDWSSAMNMTLVTATIKAADAANTAHNITLTGVLSGSGASLTKTGNGTLTLGGVNTYSGATTISAGTLALTNDGVTYFGAIASTPITVATNAIFDVSQVAAGFTLGSGKTIAGVGTVVGTFMAADNSTISPAGTSAQGKLNFANGLFVTNATLKMELTSDPTGLVTANDAISVTGDLIVGGSNNVVVVPVGSLGIGTYKLITYTGTLYADPTNFTCVAGTIDTNTLGEIDLIVTSIRPVSGLVWRGDGSGNLWDTGVSSNWLNGVSYDRFYAGDTNTFDDSATNFVVNLSGTLTPAGTSVVTVNATNDYTFTAGGDISGTTGLTKNNTGRLTIQSNHDYTGVTTINGGTLSIATMANGGAASPIGAAPSASVNLVLNGGTLEYTGNNLTTDRGATLGASGGAVSVTNLARTLTIGGTLTGPGSLTKTGNGQITLNSANNYLGGTVITAGTIRGNPASALGTNTLTLNGSASAATFLFSADSQTLSDVLNVVGSNNYLSAAGNDTISKVTGSGTVNLNGSGTQTLTLQTIDSSAFTGTFMGNTLPFLRFAPSSGTTLNASNATFNLGSGTTQLFNRDGGNYSLGALAGGSGTFMKGSGNSGSAATTYTIGGNNTDADFSGVIATGTGGTGAKVNIVKVGTGRQTFSGANTYNGTTTINSGILALGNGSTDGSFNNTTPITLASNAVLDVSLRSDQMLTLGNSQTLQGQGTISGSLTVHGTVTPDTATSGLVNTNTTITLDGGTVTVGTNVTVYGHGIINGSLLVNGTVTPGTSGATGKLTATNGVTLGGLASMKLNRTGSPHCDSLVCSNTMVFGGTLTIVNSGNPLVAGDTFTLFSAGGGISGTFAATNLPALDTGLVWTNTPSGTWSVLSTVNLNPTNIVTTVSGSLLTFTWPSDHTGWTLQVQTNNLASGLGTNWIDWPYTDSTVTNSVSVNIDPNAPTVFFRLFHP